MNTKERENETMSSGKISCLGACTDCSVGLSWGKDKLCYLRPCFLGLLQAHATNATCLPEVECIIFWQLTGVLLQMCFLLYPVWDALNFACESLNFWTRLSLRTLSPLLISLCSAACKLFWEKEMLSQKFLLLESLRTWAYVT